MRPKKRKAQKLERKGKEQLCWELERGACVAWELKAHPFSRFHSDSGWVNISIEWMGRLRLASRKRLNTPRKNIAEVFKETWLLNFSILRERRKEKNKEQKRRNGSLDGSNRVCMNATSDGYSFKLLYRHSLLSS